MLRKTKFHRMQIKHPMSRAEFPAHVGTHGYGGDVKQDIQQFVKRHAQVLSELTGKNTGRFTGAENRLAYGDEYGTVLLNWTLTSLGNNCGAGVVNSPSVMDIDDIKRTFGVTTQQANKISDALKDYFLECMARQHYTVCAMSAADERRKGTTEFAKWLGLKPTCEEYTWKSGNRVEYYWINVPELMGCKRV